MKHLIAVKTQDVERKHTELDYVDTVAIDGGVFTVSAFSQGVAPKIGIELDRDEMGRNSEQTVVTVCVRDAKNGNTAVCHLSIWVDSTYIHGNAIQAKLTAGKRHGETIKTVNVPFWNRRHA